MKRYDGERLARPRAAAARPRAAAPLRLLRTLAAALVLGVVAAGCGDGGAATGEVQTGLSAAEFVEVVTALRRAEREVEGEDSAAALYAGRKAEILAEHAVTEEELRAFLIRNKEDPTLLQEAWDSISQRLKHVPGSVDGPASADPLDPEPRGRPGPAGEQRLH